MKAMVIILVTSNKYKSLPDGKVKECESGRRKNMSEKFKIWLNM